jgi:hypothetical protein
MPSYDSLSSQITTFKAKVDALSSSTLTAQEIVFLAKALESMGNLLGVNDIVAATSASINSIQTSGTGQVTTVQTAGATQIAAVNTAGTQNIANLEGQISNYTLYTNMGVI